MSSLVVKMLTVLVNTISNSQLQCKNYSHFCSKNINVAENTLATTINEFVINKLLKTVNEFVINKLVKLTVL